MPEEVEGSSGLVAISRRELEEDGEFESRELEGIWTSTAGWRRFFPGGGVLGVRQLEALFREEVLPPDEVTAGVGAAGAGVADFFEMPEVDRVALFNFDLTDDLPLPLPFLLATLEVEGRGEGERLRVRLDEDGARGILIILS